MTTELNIDELRIRERKEFHKHILCYNCETPHRDKKVKIPFVFEVNDLSYSGMGIASAHILFQGTKLFFRLDIDETRREFCVKVIWSKYNGYQYVSGVQFLDVKREDIIFLHLILRDLK